MIQRQINTVYQILQSIAQAEIHITISQGPSDVAPQFIFEALDVITLVFGDVIRIPGECKTQAIIGCIAGLQETTYVRTLEVGVMAMLFMPVVIVGLSLMSMAFVVVISMSFVFVVPPWTIMLLVAMTFVVMIIVLGF